MTIPRKANEAPEGFSRTKIEEFLNKKGVLGIVSARGLATAISCSYRVIKNAEMSGALKKIDKCTYNRTDVANWLMANPRFISQNIQKWEVTPETYEIAKKVILATQKTMLKFWELEDLVHEVCFRMSKLRKTSECRVETVIIRTCINLWNEMKRKGVTSTVAYNEGGNNG